MGRLITKERAYAIAVGWGAYISRYDPACCMLSFYVDDGRPVSEEHRTACLRFLATVKPATKVGMREIRELTHWLIAAPLRPESAQ